MIRILLMPLACLALFTCNTRPEDSSPNLSQEAPAKTNPLTVEEAKSHVAQARKEGSEMIDLSEFTSLPKESASVLAAFSETFSLSMV